MILSDQPLLVRRGEVLTKLEAGDILIKLKKVKSACLSVAQV
jgi:hypothetical protein